MVTFSGMRLFTPIPRRFSQPCEPAKREGLTNLYIFQLDYIVQENTRIRQDKRRRVYKSPTGDNVGKILLLRYFLVVKNQ